MNTQPEMPAESNVADQTRPPEMAIIGLGRMGGGMIRRLIRSGHTIVGYNRSPDKTREVALEGAIPAYSRADLVESLPKPRAVWLMLPAGAATQAQIDELVPLLEPGDLIVDGGNSRYTDSQRRAASLGERGIHFIDAGVSGGIWGLREGFCIMAGGAAEDPGLATITGVAADSGEGRWTVEEAIRLGVPAPVVSAALFARFASQQDDSPTLKVVAALRNQFGGHAVRSS